MAALCALPWVRFGHRSFTLSNEMCAVSHQWQPYLAKMPLSLRDQSRRKAVVALYPSGSRYPKTPWTTSILAMTLLTAVLSTRHLFLPYLKAISQSLAIPATTCRVLQSTVAFASDSQFASVLLLTMLLGRAVEGTMSGPMVVSVYAS